MQPAPASIPDAVVVRLHGALCTLYRYASPLAELFAAGESASAESTDDEAFALHGGGFTIRGQREAWGWTLHLPAGAGLSIDLPPHAHWYGQGSFVRQAFPLDRVSLEPAPLMSWDNGPAGHGCIQEALWLASNGIAIQAESLSESLHAGINPRGVASRSEWVSVFEADGARPALAADPDVRRLVLHATQVTRLRLIAAADLPSAYREALVVIGHPAVTPAEPLLAAPIWTTWAKYKADINAERVLEFAHAIRTHGYPGATLEIDDRWQAAYGATDFDPQRFPDPARLVTTLRELGFATTLWITPFLAEGAANTAEAQALGHVVRHADGAPYRVRWWQGEASLLDLTSPAARDWWAAKLKALQAATGIAGYKFDAGEANFLPADAVTHTPIERSDYSRLWADFAAEHFPYGEARCGWRGQRNAILYRQWDKFSTWGEDNGLASVVTQALALGLVGYPFVLPDMVGGNAYGNTVSPELMIRWTQACAPMLAIQFSIPPWELGEAVDAICRRYADLHVALAPRRIAAARQATLDGTPPIRPMIWAAPDRAEAAAIADQYLLGDDLLVAPVLREGQTARDIWLPPGRWRDYWREAEFAGGWLRDYPAPLDALPMFERQG
ncbi:glycoside hydrolase family 31 protein [Niveibacterium umoris]|uniref:Alpha-glucosidase (Family GH31 glycosyl hydrolase) n=1 Tax=Niveibacterium umoris TaxID=1193620 RepID=A0A840BN09_9RHOO|nr:glycoside hydrolase family 31 protein [Niveibacterium umoris]MBB4014023.1 alpha-glucosidase (family GH31 glycosyl hydrolase) [Niveibacterium umoris]